MHNFQKNILGGGGPTHSLAHVSMDPSFAHDNVLPVFQKVLLPGSKVPVDKSLALQVFHSRGNLGANVD
jgi:hypothetical protein